MEWNINEWDFNLENIITSTPLNPLSSDEPHTSSNDHVDTPAPLNFVCSNPEPEYFNNDELIPIYGKKTKPVATKNVVEQIVNGEIEDRHIVKLVPHQPMENLSFFLFWMRIALIIVHKL